MIISAKYVCPVRGLASLQAPEPNRLAQAARAARSLGLERLLLPVLEESLTQTVRGKVHYLDGLIQALDRIAEAKISAWLIAPCLSMLGLSWVPPYLVRALKDPRAPLVFVDGKVRHLWPLPWWSDPSVIQKRLKILRELVSAVKGHPALSGWLLLDRALEWGRPEPSDAELVLRSFLAEIRDQDDTGEICLGLGCSELLDPEIGRSLAGRVDGLHVSGLENEIPGLPRPAGLPDELPMAAYAGALAQWLFERPAHMEIGWNARKGNRETEEILEEGKRFAEQGLAGCVWLSLADPEPDLRRYPPWALEPGLAQVGLLDRDLEPKNWVEPLLKEFQTGKTRNRADEFIDVGPEEYLADPETHLPRLWRHFREWS